MAVIIHGSGNGGIGASFPIDYPNMKSTALGDTFPGWEADIIPICITLNGTTNKYIDAPPGQTNQGAITGNETLNGKTVASITSDGIVVYSTANSKTRIDNVQFFAHSIFLPYFFNFDFDAIKNTIRSGTCTVWLER